MVETTREARLRVSRRGFLKAGGVSAALATGVVGSVPFSASRAFAQQGWDEEYDVVVVGSGGAGFAAGITAQALGSKTIILEKGAYVGGTTLVSGGGAFIPNSRQMRELGYEDPREERLKYMARYSWPHLYNPDDEKYGLTDHDFEMISAYYDKGPEAIDFLEQAGAATYAVQMIYGSVPPVPNVDYMDHFEENVPKEAGTLATLDPDGNVAGGGNMIASYMAWADANGLEVRLGHRVERVVVDDSGAVIGVEVSITDAAAATPTPAVVKTFRASKGVIFCSGGFTKNDDMMHNLMFAPHLQGCGAPTNEGDFLRIASSLGAKLGNLHNVYRNEGIYEQGIATPSAYNCIWFHKGDSMLVVNGKGKRFHNERRNYQDRPMAHLSWDPNDATWPNLLGYLVYDQRVAENWAGNFPYPKLDTEAPFVIKADTLEELGAAIRQRVASLPSVTKGMALADDFEANLVAEVAKYNGYAAAGKDDDFQRGEFGYDEGWQTAPSVPSPTIAEWPSADQPLKSMYPLAETGPYYAIIVAAAAVDTNGGPVINTNGQVLSYDGTPIEGLYGSGNCIASPGVNAYWVGGMTLGNAHVWGYAAGKHAHESAGR
ncbi:MAG: FAD-dependent oxidoreductase [Thermomicrobiales bacterium]|nr:FAD-dependent oxidoreductase [Thermomicrobiales bacterium]